MRNKIILDEYAHYKSLHSWKHGKVLFFYESRRDILKEYRTRSKHINMFEIMKKYRRLNSLFLSRIKWRRIV